MAVKVSRDVIRRRVHTRIRKKVSGTGERPRLAVFRSNKHIYAQLIDDSQGVTIVSAGTTEVDTKKAVASGGNVAAAKEVGRLIAERAKEKGVSAVLFDRGGYIYHGRVQALAESAREAGLQF
jgi:large subunit ribosomal protein L18